MTASAARGPSGRSLAAPARSAIEQVVSAAGLDLEEISALPAGRRRVLRIVVDGDDGVSLDAVAALSRALSDRLDRDDLVEGAYTLEVTSPGVDRPLTTVRHWRRARGRLVRAVLRDGGTVIGRVEAADERCVVLDVDGARREFGYDAVARASVQVEFRRPDRDDATPDAGPSVGPTPDESGSREMSRDEEGVPS